MKVAEAKTFFAERYDDGPPGLLELTRDWYDPQDDADDNQVPADCPACDSLGLALGSYEVEWEADEWEGDRPISASGKVWFVTSSFECRVCKLRLNSMAEAQAAGLSRYEVEGADASKYEGSAELDRVDGQHGYRH